MKKDFVTGKSREIYVVWRENSAWQIKKTFKKPFVTFLWNQKLWRKNLKEPLLRFLWNKNLGYEKLF